MDVAVPPDKRRGICSMLSFNFYGGSGTGNTPGRAGYEA